MMYLKDLKSNEYAMQATTTVDNEVNGNQSLSGIIEYTSTNAVFIDNIDRLWRVFDHNDVEYVITTLTRRGKGDKMYVEFTADLFFLYYMNTHSMMDDKGDHYRFDGSQTAYVAASKIFADTPFNFALLDEFSAKEWENFGGGESRLETFKRWLERHHAEFRIVGSTVYMENQIGRETSIQYRHKFNASDIQHEIDASEQYTVIRGYGHFGEGQNEDSDEEDYRDARLKRVYESPLANVLGKIYAPPFMDGRVKIQAEMDRKLKEFVDNSLKVSVSANIHNLTRQGYPIDNSQAGDKVFLIDERIGFDQEVRIISQSITRNWRGEVIDANITFGSEGLGKRHQSSINTAVKNVTDIFEGRKEIPLSAHNSRVQEISKIINGNTDSIFKYMSNGIVGWNGDDPNYMTKYVGDALGFSKDGGVSYGTAMSAELGFVADYITTGTLRSIEVDAVDIYGSYIEGGTISQTGFGYETIMQYGNIETYSNNTLTSILNASGHTFYKGGTELMPDKIGHIGTSTWTDDESYRGLRFGLETEADYMSWGFRETDGDDFYTTMLSWHRTSSKDYKGFNFSDNVTFKYPVTMKDSLNMSNRGYLKSYANAFEIGVRGPNYHITQYDDGQVQFHTGSSSATHVFFPDGTKKGGSIEIGGIKYGMSPIESPQLLIEYIEFDVKLEEKGVKVYLDDLYIKAISNYSVHMNNGALVSKHENYFIVKGEGLADIRIVGKRVEYEKAFWGEMEKSADKSDENMKSSKSVKTKNNWYKEILNTTESSGKIKEIHRRIQNE